ncbi:HNH endonuclease [uncultured archaeon]|nr:HNH endonuclease [uncultured archaeon]
MSWNFEDYDFHRETMYVDANGYPRFIHNKKLVHREVEEQTLCRKLEPDEIVHHINGNKMDFRPDNLKQYPNQKVHEEAHKNQKRETGEWHGRTTDIGWIFDLISNIVGAIGKRDIKQGILFFVIGIIIGLVLHSVYPQWDINTISCITVCFPLIILFIILIASIRRKWNLYGRKWAIFGTVIAVCGFIISITSITNPIVGFIGMCIIFAGVLFTFAQDNV